MGMDVYGKNPTSERGEYFRNNVWWWRPLWNYCESVAPILVEGVSGHYNDGDGLDEKGAKSLASLLQEEILSGRTAEYQRRYNDEIASLPREDCRYCDATGIRRDKVGLEMSQPEKELSPEVQILTGRTHGWCNSCQGVGTVEAWATAYPFTVENVQEFVEFLRDSGGFSIC